MERREELLSLQCPIAITQDIFAGKWKILIIWRLKDGVKRFNQLQREIPNIRPGYLTQQLREMEMDGLVHREVYREVPPKVEYSLTEIGTKMLTVLDKMAEWGLEYRSLLENQEPEQRSS